MLHLLKVSHHPFTSKRKISTDFPIVFAIAFETEHFKILFINYLEQ